MDNFCNHCCKEDCTLKCKCGHVYYCNEKCMKKNQKEHQIFCNSDLDTIVKKSRVHGVGVFVTRDVKKDEKLCYFHGIEYDPSEPIPSELLEPLLTYRGSFFDAESGKKIFIIGYKPPQDPRGIAQLINDGAILKLSFLENKNNLPKYNYQKYMLDHRKYKLEAKKYVNVYSSLYGWYYAQRDLNKGEELFISYGKDFWITLYKMGYIDMEYDHELQNFLLMSINNQYFYKQILSNDISGVSDILMKEIEQEAKDILGLSLTGSVSDKIITLWEYFGIRYIEDFTQYKMFQNNGLPATVKKSPVHGIGVFANIDIKKGEPICCYDGYNMSKSNKFIEQFYIENMDYFINSPWNETSRVGYKIPVNARGIGQLMNDVDIISIDFNKEHIKDLKFSECIKKIATYYDQSKQAGAIIGNVYFVMNANKDIKAGEEITFWYGPMYWISKCYRDSEIYPIETFLYNILLSYVNTKTIKAEYVQGLDTDVKELLGLDISDKSEAEQIKEVMKYYEIK